MTVIGAAQQREEMVPADVNYSAEMYERALGVLRGGRALIQRPWGWCKSHFTSLPRKGTPYPAHCVIGALQWGAVEDGEAYTVADGLLADSLPEGWKHDHGHIYKFNDDPTTKKADVLALYDRAIALGEEKFRAASE